VPQEALGYATVNMKILIAGLVIATAAYLYGLRAALAAITATLCIFYILAQA
jgi:hypothetical protein